MFTNLFKSTILKLLLLVFTVFMALIFSAILFNSQVEKLKKQIDLLYFGDFIPVVKLQAIKSDFENIIICLNQDKNCNIDKEKKSIMEEWSYYYSSFKTAKEKELIESINSELIKSFDENSIESYKRNLNNSDFLIKYETKQAFSQRKAFLEEYEQMQNYIFYNILFILIFAFIIILFIVYQIIKKDKQLQILNKKYQIESITDALTNLYNRKHFDTIFDSMTFISNENTWNSALVIIDIDYFKDYNDTYGHDMGDIALKKVSQCIKEHFSKKYEYSFRLGGEEFGVILFNINEDSLKNYLQELNEKVIKLQIEHKNSKILDLVSVSIGAVLYESKTYISANRLYKMADESLYLAKNNGRNRYKIYKKEEE
ncbi:GGDEF domain-containing protein [Arcobacter vandammei]|uniref:GGDEF domain-containing protein n=1 Tax=Arcobacter vandammei TaxID=2782243 RepID=UPI0018E05F51|nr:GGDEF domain-containing protein [Arcobacter vandammei]